ncbi:MAG: hypothetical protein Q4D11_04115 [Rhodospirillales bacterium]|nr:hypothetical protein [Rhodospirillales bacterium]
MSGEFLHNFCMYQNAMMNIGKKTDCTRVSDYKESSLDLDISDMMSAAYKAERKLSDVMSVSDSYNEILKMIM